MKVWRMVLALGLLTMSVTVWAQTDGQSGGTFGSPDIYNTGKTGSKTLPPEGSKTAPAGNANAPDNASGTDPLKRTLQEIYNRCVAATKKRDESVLAALRMQDFTYRDAKGKTYSRGDVEAGERQALSNAVSIDRVSSQVDAVKTDGGKTTATLHHFFAETVNDAQNKPHKMTLTTTSQEIWTTAAANAWKLQSVKVISQQETLDGKSYDPTAPNNSARQNNRNNQNNGNRQTGRNNGYNGYRAPRIRTPKLRSGGTISVGGTIR